VHKIKRFIKRAQPKFCTGFYSFTGYFFIEKPGSIKTKKGPFFLKKNLDHEIKNADLKKKKFVSRRFPCLLAIFFQNTMTFSKGQSSLTFPCFPGLYTP